MVSKGGWAGRRRRLAWFGKNARVWTLFQNYVNIWMRSDEELGGDLSFSDGNRPTGGQTERFLP